MHVIVQGNPDLDFVTTLARWLYDYLLPAGVHIHEFRERPLHAKVAVVDGQWSTVGSSNLDPLSLALNLESNLVVDDAAFAADLRAKLEALMDTARCRRIHREDVPGRSLWTTLRMRFVLYALQRFPAWAGWLPAHRPRLVRVAPEPGGG